MLLARVDVWIIRSELWTGDKCAYSCLKGTKIPLVPLSISYELRTFCAWLWNLCLCVWNNSPKRCTYTVGQALFPDLSGNQIIQKVPVWIPWMFWWGHRSLVIQEVIPLHINNDICILRALQNSVSSLPLKNGYFTTCCSASPSSTGPMPLNFHSIRVINLPFTSSQSSNPDNCPWSTWPISPIQKQKQSHDPKMSLQNFR
jgi:hypothetical protein